VQGVIRGTWSAQGWELGRLSYPLSDELVTPNTGGRGRYSQFVGGTVYWTPEGGARVVLSNVPVELWFTGFKCLDESSEWSASDEPYMFLGVSTSGTPQTPFATGVQSVDAGSIRRWAARLYSGVAQDIILAASIFEQDQGDPHAAADEFNAVLTLGNAALGATTGVVVPPALVDTISKGLSEVIGTGDDRVGHRASPISTNELINMALRPEGGDPTSDFTWDLGSDSEGIYRLYFFVKRR
jgi:hypothetical protein